MMKKVCRVCGKEICITKTGEFRNHRIDINGQSFDCPGSRMHFNTTKDELKTMFENALKHFIEKEKICYSEQQIEATIKEYKVIINFLK